MFQSSNLLLRPNGNSPFSSNSAKRSVSSDNVSTPYSQVTGTSDEKGLSKRSPLTILFSSDLWNLLL